MIFKMKSTVDQNRPEPDVQYFLGIINFFGILHLNHFKLKLLT